MIYFSTPKYEYVVIKKAKIINKINPKLSFFQNQFKEGERLGDGAKSPCSSQ